MFAERSRYNLINKWCLGPFIVPVKSRVFFSSYLRSRCGFCTSRKVRSSHIPLNWKTCSTGLQRTAGTATSQFRTVVGCTMTNASSKTPDLIKTMRPTRRRRQVAVLMYCSLLLNVAMFCVAQFVMLRYFVSVWPETRVCFVLVTVVCVVTIKILICWLQAVHQTQTRCTHCTHFL